MHDPVNSPKHYQLFTEEELINMPGIEVIDVREKLLLEFQGTEGFTPVTADHFSRSWEYLTRAFKKNGLEDLKKARWYLDRMINELERLEDGY